MNIVFVGHSATDPHLVVGSHQLAREAAGLGHRVLHLSSPITPMHWCHIADRRTRSRLQRNMVGVHKHGNGFFESIPFSRFPWQLARQFDIRANNLFVPTRGAIDRCLRRAGMSSVDLLFVDEPRLVGIERRIRARRFGYRATDLYAKMKDDPSITQAEEVICDRADAIYGTSHRVSEHLSLVSNREVSTVENGVDLSHFRQQTTVHPLLASIPRPRAIYVGAVDFRLDCSGLRCLAMKHPDISFVVCGPVLTELPSKLPNLHFVGPIAYRDLPSVLPYCDVALLPLNDHPSNDGRSPMKLYEYAAAGLPVLSKATVELRRRRHEFIRLYCDIEEAALMLPTLLAQSVSKRELTPFSWRTRLEILITDLQASSHRVAPSVQAVVT